MIIFPFFVASIHRPSFLMFLRREQARRRLNLHAGNGNPVCVTSAVRITEAGVPVARS